MNQDLLQLAVKLNKAKRRRKRWIKVVSVMSCVVVFVTTYALILPAITEERPLVCTYEEHQHDETCYLPVEQLVCPLEENHLHSEGCFEEREKFICGLEVTDGHTHGEACYEQRPCFICGLEEDAGHAHGDDCYTTETTTICDLSESPGHIHEESCFETLLICQDETAEHNHVDSCFETTVICGLSEGDGAHTHGDDCRTEEIILLCTEEEREAHIHDETCIGTETTLVCVLTESDPHTHDASCIGSETVTICGQEENHVHSELCYVTENVLCCELEEHTHSDACYREASDNLADLETSADWDALFRDMERTGIWPDDLLNAAKTQLGYKESTRNFIYDEAGNKKGYTRYGEWFGSPYGDWCAMYVAFCMEYAGITEENFPRNAACDYWVEELHPLGLYAEAGDYTPLPGDLIFYDWDEDPYAEHIGIVSDIDGTVVTAIEGNTSNTVDYRTYELTDPCILGYGLVHQAYEDSIVIPILERIYSDESVTVRVCYTEEAGIPEEAELRVTKIGQDSEDADYEAHLLEAQSLLENMSGPAAETTITEFQLYDISFVLNGEEIEPLIPLDVEIHVTSEQITETADISVIHFAEDGIEMPPVYSLTTDEDGTISAGFEAESFSLYAVAVAETYAAASPLADSGITLIQTGAATGTPFAIVDADGYALTVSGTSLSSVAVTKNNDGSFSTADSTLLRWNLTNSGQGYRISTTINNRTYYLRYRYGSLSLTATSSSATSFTIGSNSIMTSNRYLTISSGSVSMSSSQNAIGFYVEKTAPKVLFDGQMGRGVYYDKSVYKYDGADRIEVTADDNGYVTLPSSLSSTGNYPYKVIGWYDIGSDTYYALGEGNGYTDLDANTEGQQVLVSGDTVFYPDYISASYNIGTNSNVVANQPDTSDFITTHVFDYNELFNMQSADYTGNFGDLYNTNSWTVSGDSFGIVFSDWVKTTSGGGSGYVGRPSGMDDSNNSRGTSASRNAAGHRNFSGTITTGLTERTGNVTNSSETVSLIDALFTTSDVPGREYVGEGDWLYQFDSATGYYYYNSALNAASYNQAEQRFYVYNYTDRVNGTNKDFLPFNSPGHNNKTIKTDADGSYYAYDEKNTDVNYWFGMSSSIRFYLPDDSGSGNNQAASGADMQFHFSGDDDVWVFIDGQLVLDLGGVHDTVYGEINFSDGTVTTAHTGTGNGAGVTNTSGMPVIQGSAGTITTTALPRLSGGTTHTLTVYYLERGSSLSNCSIYFNIAPLYELEIWKRDKENRNILADAEFSIFKDPDCTQPASLYLLDDYGNKLYVTNVFTTGADGSVSCSGLLPGQSYYIKETKPPPVTKNSPGYPDMSKYVIKLDLSSTGNATVIILDSNGTEWIFADAYRFSDTGHRILLDVYNQEYFGGGKELYVEKVWANLDGETDVTLPDSITVNLLANGEETSRSIVLNEGNDWKGRFLELPETDSGGNEILYTVAEVQTEGFHVSYSEIVHQDEETGATTDGWRITNTYVPDSISIPVQKQWDSSVLPDDRIDIQITLYSITDDTGSATALESLILSAKTDWKGTFRSIPLPPEGTHYVLVETTKGYSIYYSGQTETIYLQDKPCTAATVTPDESGTVEEIVVTNIVHQMLPETGGCGNQNFIIAGLLLMSAAAGIITFRYLRKPKPHSTKVMN